MINILAAYTFTVRYFNGDHFDFVQESFSYIVNLSLNLKKDVNFDSFIAAVDSIQQESVTVSEIRFISFLNQADLINFFRMNGYSQMQRTST